MNDKKDIVGRIHSIETCGTLDGPVIRYVVFMQGCHLRCMYCHNPDTWSGASGTKMHVNEIIRDAIKYKSYFQFSGGGLTLSGGEPLLQPDFGLKLFWECKREGLHTTLDTSGHVPLTDTIREILANTDLVMLDMKSIDEHTFKKVTGQPLRPQLEFAEYLKKQNIKVWVRFVYVPDLTDNEKELHQMAEFIKQMPNVEATYILPFHQMGMPKWETLGLDYQLTHHRVPSEEETLQVKELFRGYGLEIR